MKDGVIANFEVTEKMLQHFIRKAHNGKSWVRPRVVIGIPSEITQVERRAVEDSAYRAKASEVYLVEEAMAAAIGAGLPITSRTEYGRGHRRRNDRHRRHLAFGHRLLARRARRRQRDGRSDYAVIKRKYNLLIGERTAEASNRARFGVSA
jgi:rod shape-determining protein MreB